MKFKIIVFILFYVSIIHEKEDRRILDTIPVILLENYDRNKPQSFMELIVISIGRRSYAKSLYLWRDHYPNIDSIQIQFDYAVEDLIKRIEKSTDNETASEFRSLWTELQRLSMSNFTIFYNAVMASEYTTAEFSCSYIDVCLANQQYYPVLLASYQKENEIKEKIRNILVDKRLVSSLRFELYIFDVISVVRKRSADRLFTDLQKLMLEGKL